MITGFNTDVEYDGRMFHVQTEDRGRANPVVESLVYSGGEIVDSVRTSYEDVMVADEYSEAEVLRRMENQHQALIRAISNGKYDPEGPKPFGYNIITNRSLDAVVLDYLTQELGVERVRLEMDDHPPLVEGETPCLGFRVIEESTERPVAGAQVVLKVLSAQARPRMVFSGVTDEDGRVEAKFELPTAETESALVCQALADRANAEVKRLVRKRGA